MREMTNAKQADRTEVALVTVGRLRNEFESSAPDSMGAAGL